MTSAIYEIRIQTNDPYMRRPGVIRVLAEDLDTARGMVEIQPDEHIREIVELARL